MRRRQSLGKCLQHTKHGVAREEREELAREREEEKAMGQKTA
jgi:hypothetical protein